MKSILGESTRRPDITFYKSGLINFSTTITQLLGLNDGCVIDLLHDKQGELYLYVRTRCCGDFRCKGKVYSGKKGTRSYRIHSVKLSRYVLDHCGIENEKASFVVGAPKITDFGLALPINTKLIL